MSSSDDDGASRNVGRTTQRQKRELKELRDRQKRETSKLKSKAEKREVDATYRELEAQMLRRHAEELNSNASQPPHHPSNGVPDPPNHTDKNSPTCGASAATPVAGDMGSDEPSAAAEAEGTDGEKGKFVYGSGEISKAQKKRQRKQQREQDKRNEILASVAGCDDLGALEMDAIVKQLQMEALAIHNIPSDGNCLYRALEHQLRLYQGSVSGGEGIGVGGGADQAYTHVQLRRMAADYIRKHRDEFLPFMDDNLTDDASFERYCDEVAETAAWGGDLELRALSEAMRLPIRVYCGIDKPSITYGEDLIDGGRTQPLRVSYHRHLFALGEHYNSVLPSQVAT